jgi:hypothetical protein
MLYIGCDQNLSLRKEKYLTVENLSDNEKPVMQWFDTKNVFYIGSR